MSVTSIGTTIPTFETGGLHKQLDSIEAALDYTLIKRENSDGPLYELWDAAYSALADAARSHDPADLADARARLEEAIGVARRA
ncbi:hypothetical protein [Jeongeupia naejangsanensis]|uniref:Uncharacterized protein n=1 Tax=Jeongeupia naejangsanensis TaxID=613195 RepID=A0ABS2BPH9_9NEIS|nr:hypothetical protein [Jeongeupia naejangsanensis]MBM3117524.1 hypothetical protein [Jeongeupia naejangsanensis]